MGEMVPFIRSATLKPGGVCPLKCRMRRLKMEGEGFSPHLSGVLLFWQNYVCVAPGSSSSGPKTQNSCCVFPDSRTYTHKPTRSCVKCIRKQLCLSFIHFNPANLVILTLDELQQLLMWLQGNPLDFTGRMRHVLQPKGPCNLFLPSRRTQRVRVGAQMLREHELLEFCFFWECSALVALGSAS